MLQTPDAHLYRNVSQLKSMFLIKQMVKYPHAFFLEVGQLYKDVRFMPQKRSCTVSKTGWGHKLGHSLFVKGQQQSPSRQNENRPDTE